MSKIVRLSTWNVIDKNTGEVEYHDIQKRQQAETFLSALRYDGKDCQVVPVMKEYIRTGFWKKFFSILWKNMRGDSEVASTLFWAGIVFGVISLLIVIFGKINSDNFANVAITPVMLTGFGLLGLVAGTMLDIPSRRNREVPVQK